MDRGSTNESARLVDQSKVVISVLHYFIAKAIDPHPDGSGMLFGPKHGWAELILNSHLLILDGFHNSTKDAMKYDG